MFEDREIVRESEDGKYRAVLIRDECPTEPYDDGEVPILRIESYRYTGGYRAEAVNKQAEPYAAAYNRFEDHGGHSTEVFERYLRIFHDSVGVRSYTPDNYRSDYEYFAFDTAEWREQVGVDKKYLEPGTYMTEYVDYLEGEVYGMVIEELKTGACGHEGCAEHKAWEDAEQEAIWIIKGERRVMSEPVSIWGLYGDNDYTRSEVIDYHFPEFFEATAA